MSAHTAAIKKLELKVSQAGFTVRYAAGSFSSGYCVLNSEKIIIINKFLSDSSKLHSLQILAKEFASW